MQYILENCSLEQVQTTIDSIPIGICIWSEQNMLIACNKTILEMLGLKNKNELKGGTDFIDSSMLMQICGTPTNVRLEQVLDELKEKNTITTQWLHRNVDGEMIPAEVTITKMTFHGEPVRVAYTRALDVERYTKDNPEEVSVHLKALYSSKIMGISLWDSEFNLMDCNPRLLEMLKIDSKEELARNFHNFSPQVQPCGRTSYKLAYLINKKIRSEGWAIYEWKHITATGEDLYIRVHAERIYFKGKVVSLCMVQDLTYEKNLQYEIGKTQDRAVFMFNNAPIGISMWSDSCIIDANSFLWKSLGFESKEDCLENFFRGSPELQPCGTPSDVLCKELNAAAILMGSLRTEWMFKTADGAEFPTELSIELMQYDGENVLLVYVRDLREEKAMLNELNIKRDALQNALVLAEKANHAKDHFLANMSHELRTPLNAILGITQISLQKDLDPAMQNNFEKIKESGVHLLSIINNIIDVADIEADQFDLNNKPFFLEKILYDVGVELRAEVARKQINVVFDTDANMPMHYLGDGPRLEQVLKILCHNAAQYTQQGSITVKIKLVSREDNVYSIKIAVEDTGLGIDKRDFERIFQPFEQVSQGYTRISEGAGLGLTLCKKIVEHMGGSVCVESEVGVGSTFTVQFNLWGVDSYHDEAIHTQGATSTDIYADDNHDVLLVDDNVTNLEIGKVILEDLGFNVFIAENGLEAVEKCKQQVFAYVFMDIQMPVMDGLEATKIIRQIPGYYKGELPIFAVTAHATKAHKELSLQTGMDAHITKPINIAVLREHLIAWQSKAKEDMAKN